MSNKLRLGSAIAAYDPLRHRASPLPVYAHDESKWLCEFILNAVDHIPGTPQIMVYLPGIVGVPGERVAARGAFEGDVEGFSVGLNVVGRNVEGFTVGFRVGERDGELVCGLIDGVCDGDALGMVGFDVETIYRSVVT